MEYILEKRRDNCRTKIKNYFEDWLKQIKEMELKALAEFEHKSDLCFKNLDHIFKEIDVTKENIKNDV